MKLKNKKNFCILILVIIFLISILVILNSKQIQKIIQNRKTEEANKDISFQIYSNENDILKFLVTVKDTEDGIKKIIYTLEDGQQKEIDCYGKTQVSMDYEVVQNGNYQFKVINQKDKELTKELVIDDDYRNNLIPIDVATEKSIDTRGKVKIEYPENEKFTKMYKIGENGKWTEYNGEFSIDSYEIIKENLQNKNTKKVDIYAKLEDKANNIVQIKKEIDNIDVDMPEEPKVNVLKVDEYPTLTEEWVINNSTVSIKYDDRTDITNYYSIDNGETWIKYAGDLNLDVAAIIAKSIKNDSGLEISKKEFINASALNAVNAVAYDGDETTGIYYQERDGTLTQYLNVDNSVKGKYINLLGHGEWNFYGTFCNIFFYSDSGEELSKYSYGVYRVTTNLNENILCPENCSKIKIELTSSENCKFTLYEIRPAVIPKVNYEFVYPTITSNGVQQSYENITFEFFENLISSEYKINDGDWINYTLGDVVRLEIGETITVRARYPRTVQTATRTAKNLDDALQSAAFDGDEKTGVYYNGRDGTLTQYLNVDSSINGKYINLFGHGELNYYGTTFEIYFYNDGDEVLESHSYGGRLVETNLNENILCPENCTKIKIELSGHEYCKFNLYEIRPANM